MKIKLERTDDYKAQRKALGTSARIALFYVEQAIKSNPDDPPGFGYRRYHIPELETTVTVVENGGLLVGFHRIGSAVVSMDMALDRRRGADWYSRD